MCSAKIISGQIWRDIDYQLRAVWCACGLSEIWQVAHTYITSDRNWAATSINLPLRHSYEILVQRT
jgi:hypothetical protein